MYQYLLIISLLYGWCVPVQSQPMRDIQRAHHSGNKIKPGELFTVTFGVYSEINRYRFNDGFTVLNPGWEQGNIIVRSQLCVGLTTSLTKNIWRWVNLKLGVSAHKDFISFSIQEVGIDRIDFQKRSVLIPQISVGATVYNSDLFGVNLWTGYGKRYIFPKHPGVVEQYNEAGATVYVTDWQYSVNRSIAPLELEVVYHPNRFSVLLNAAFLPYLPSRQPWGPNLNGNVEVVYEPDSGSTKYGAFTRVPDLTHISLQFAYTIQ